jgi:hypothetical protein
VAAVDLFFSPVVPLADTDTNGLALQEAIVAAIVNETDLVYAEAVICTRLF